MPTDVAQGSGARGQTFPDALVVVDSTGAIVEADGRLSAMTGRARTSLIGQPVSTLFESPAGEHFATALQRWAAGTAPARTARIRLPLRTEDRASPTDVRVAVEEDRFVLVVRDLTAGADDLRVRLLDALTSPVVDRSVLEDVAATVGDSLPWDRAVVWSMRGEVLEGVAVWSRVPEADDEFARATLAEARSMPGGFLGDVARSGHGRRATAEEITAESRYQLLATPPQVVAVVPAAIGDRTMGVVELLASDDADVDLWMTSDAEAVRTGVARVLDRFQQRLRAETAEHRLAVVLDAGELGVWTLDERVGRAEWTDRMATMHGVTTTRGDEELLFAEVVEDDRSALDAVRREVRASERPLAVDYRVRVGGSDRWLSTRFVHVDRDGWTVLAAVSADITTRKRAEVAQRRRRAVVEALRWVHEAIIAGEALDDTAQAVVARACEVLGAQLGAVVHPVPGDVGQALSRAVHGVPDPDVPSSELALPSGRLADNRVTMVDDARRDAAFAEFLALSGLPVENIGAALIAPIRGHDQRVIGCLLVGHGESGYFGDEDAELAVSIASTTGVAIANALRHEQQRLAAMTFQRELLPGDAFDVDKLDICVRYHPGRAGMDVGGDWYDVIDLGPHRVGLAVGDVCGHGFNAAAHMGQLRHSFRALVQAATPPSEALQVLNRMALHELRTTATIAYVEIDTRTGACTTWVCGHLPPVVGQADGSARWLVGEADSSPLLGFLDRIDVRAVHGTLGSDESLLLYTDGLIERRGESIEVGLDRLQRSFAGAPVLLDELCDLLHKTLAEVSEEADDIALLAVRRT